MLKGDFGCVRLSLSDPKDRSSVDIVYSSSSSPLIWKTVSRDGG